MARIPHEDLKSLLIAEATQITTREGLPGLSARRLAQSASCSVGTLYNLFGDLDGLIRAMNLEAMAHLHAELEAAPRTATSREDRLIALAHAYLAFALANPLRWDALFRSRLTAPPDKAIESAADSLFDLLRDAAGGSVDDDALRALWAAVHGVVELAASERHGITTEKQAQYIELIIRAGLRGLQALQSEA